MTDEHHGAGGSGTDAPSPAEVAAVLAERIRSGVLKAGERMPTQEHLAQEFHVERRAIRQALDLLRGDGLLTAGGKGAPARVVVPSAADSALEEPRQTAAALGPRIMEAFEARRVHIDAICLTAESLTLALAEPLRLVHTGRICPQSVHVRVLVPARDLNVAFPRPAEESVDQDAVHEHWLSRRNAHGSALQLSLQALTTRGIDVDVTLRSLPFTPLTKLYLLNGTEALFAYYNVKRRTERIGGTPSPIFDALGSDSVLFAFEKHGARRDEAFVAQSQAWFNSLWETLATDIAPDG
ncbi:GntR family transcriptional regulator [Streptomyces sp. NPDC006208]|uniref:GntR family transcriptional regulator n=1 Tax=Streptomyces sp. NPDC006208 TaxID=3156734 RepID=UPI0033B69DE8